MKIAVHMFAFANGAIRWVEIPQDVVPVLHTAKDWLEMVFHYGQNDFQPQPMPSVSMGDVVELHKDGQTFWRCEACGWKPVSKADFDLMKSYAKGAQP